MSPEPNKPARVCPGCRTTALLHDPLPYDGYFNTAPGCWAMFTEVCGREFGNAIVFGAVHQLTVDSYAVQHAGGPHPDKSICIHLCGLSLVHELGFKPTSVATVLQRIAGANPIWPYFVPPEEQGSMTIADVWITETPEAHIDAAESWSREVWNVWSAHHEAIAVMIEEHGVKS